MMKKILLTLTTFVLMISMCCNAICAEEEILVNVDFASNASLKILSDHTVSFKNKHIVYSTFSVPASVCISGTYYNVSTISKDAFNGTYINTVILPDTITTVNAQAFKGDTGLREIRIESPNITFNRNAFKGLSRKQIRAIKVVVDVNQVPWANYKVIKQSLIRLGFLRGNIDLR